MLSRIYSSGLGRAVLAGTLGASMLAGVALPIAQASTLTQGQISSIVSLLQSFNVGSTTIANIQTVLAGGTASSTGTVGIRIGLLKRGDHGQAVCYLHAVLAADPNVSISITANDSTGDCPFGALTEGAVKSFQKKHGISQTGTVGPKTLAAINDDIDNNGLTTEDEDSNATSTSRGGEHGRLCAKVPPGHLIAPGWLRHNEKPVVPECQKLPHGIEKNTGDDHHGTTTPPVVTDTTPPVISSISAGSLASTTATISWTTNESASSKVYYSTASPINLSTALTLSAGGNVTSHSVMLTGLTASTTYQYVVSSSDAAANVATSSPQNFTTTN